MREVGLLVGLLLVAGPVYADVDPNVEEPTPPVEVVEQPVDKLAVVNDPKEAATQTKDVIDVFEPTAEAIYDLENTEWSVGTSGSIYNFTSHQIHLGRAKVGYLSANAIYGGLDVDLPGIRERYLDTKWPQLDLLLERLAKYAAVGYVVGYNFDSENAVHGPSFGATLRF